MYTLEIKEIRMSNVHFKHLFTAGLLSVAILAVVPCSTNANYLIIKTTAPISVVKANNDAIQRQIDIQVLPILNAQQHSPNTLMLAHEKYDVKHISLLSTLAEIKSKLTQESSFNLFEFTTFISDQLQYWLGTLSKSNDNTTNQDSNSPQKTQAF